MKCNAKIKTRLRYDENEIAILCAMPHGKRMYTVRLY